LKLPKPLPSRVGYAVGALVVAVGGIIGGSAFAGVGGPHATTVTVSATDSASSPVGPSAPKSVPIWAREAFSVFRKSATPLPVSGLVRDAQAYYGLNLALTRRVTVEGTAVAVAVGQETLCVVALRAAMGCSPRQLAVRQGGLVVRQCVGGSTTAEIVGVVPDGVDSVEITKVAGGQIRAEPENNVFVATTHEPVAGATLVGARRIRVELPGVGNC
jgi:hypothetical protein